MLPCLSQVGSLQEQSGQLAEKAKAAEARATAAEQSSDERSQQLLEDLRASQSQCKEAQVRLEIFSDALKSSFGRLQSEVFWRKKFQALAQQAC